MMDPKSRIPLYYQLLDILLEKIRSGELKTDDKLPSERELCDLYEISRSTVRQTMLEMEREGYIYKKHGKGTFVAAPYLKQDLSGFYSFTDEMKKLGKVPSSHVLEFAVIEADKETASMMGLTEGELVIKFKRLRLADSEPMMYEKSFIPYERFAGVTREQLEKRPMYEILREDYQVRFTDAEEIFKPVFPKAHEAKQLKIKGYTPCMLIERITREGQEVVEYTVGIARGDKFEYRVVLKTSGV